MNIEEILKWEHKLKNLENFVAKQIIKKIHTGTYPEDYMTSHLTNLMKTYSVRVVFEACIGLIVFDLKKIKDKCQHVFEKNMKLLDKPF